MSPTISLIICTVSIGYVFSQSDCNLNDCEIISSYCCDGEEYECNLCTTGCPPINCFDSNGNQLPDDETSICEIGICLPETTTLEFDTTKAELDTTKLDIDTTELDFDTTDVGTTTTEFDFDTTELDFATTEFDFDTITTEFDFDTTESEFDTTEFDFDTTEFITTEGPDITNGTCCVCITEDRNQIGCPTDGICEVLVCADDDNTVGGDARCCTHGWRDDPCAEAARSVCDNIDPCCLCLEEDNNPGCSADAECETEICATDPYCCNGAWDKICVKQARAVCNDEDIPKCCGCTVQNQDGGCPNDQECELQICEEDPYCCGEDQRQSGFWDEVCAKQAGVICGDITTTAPPSTIQPSTTTTSTTSNGDGDGDDNGDDDGGFAPVDGANRGGFAE